MRLCFCSRTLDVIISTKNFNYFFLSLDGPFVVAQLLPLQSNRCLIKLYFKGSLHTHARTHTHTQTAYSSYYNIVCVGVISESPTTPQRLSLISHEWLGCCNEWNHRRCETGCETVVISYVIALWRLGGLNHARHSPLAANHAANDKWNIRLPLITMASQGQDLTQIANTNKWCHCCLGEELLLQSLRVVWYKLKAEGRTQAWVKPSEYDTWWLIRAKHQGGLQLWCSDEKWSKGSRQKTSCWPLLMCQMLVAQCNSASKV